MIRHSNQTGIGLIFALAAIIFSLATASVFKYISQPSFASEPTLETDTSVRFVSIFDSGTRTTVKTSAGTVAEVLEQAGFEIEEHDSIEPALDEIIVTKQFYINIYRAHPAVVIDGDVTRKVMTANSDPRVVAVAAGFEIHDKDIIAPAPITPDLLLESGTISVYQIHRSKVVHFSLYGKVVDIHTNAETVGEMLREQNITLADGDELTVEQSALLKDGMKFALNHNRSNVIVVDEEIPYTVREILDYGRDKGYYAVQSAGANGSRTVTYEISIQNGVEVGRKELNEIIISQPVEEVVVVGSRVYMPEGSHTDWMRQAGIAESDFGYVNFIIQKESGWSFTARNSGSGAYGLCQALPGTKMASAGSDWEYNPVTQLRWCNGYALSRYGSWEGAYNFWISRYWW